MVHEGITPVLLKGHLGQLSHIELQKALQTVPEHLRAPENPTTAVTLGHFVIRGAPYASALKNSINGGDDNNTSRITRPQRGIEPVSRETAYCLREIQQRFSRSRLGGIGLTAVALKGLLSQSNTVLFRAIGEVDEAVKSRLGFVDELRSDLLHQASHPIFTSDEPAYGSMDLRFTRVTPQDDAKEQDIEIGSTLDAALAAIERLEFAGPPQLIFGPTTPAPPEAQERIESRRVS